MSADPVGGDGRPPPSPSAGGEPAGSGRASDRLTALTLLACVAFNPPILRAFGAGDAVFGWPLLYVYIFVVWGVVIVLAALLLDRRGGAPT